MEKSLPVGTSGVEDLTEIKKHPTFSRILKKFPSISSNSKESGHMWDIIHSLLPNNRLDFPTSKILKSYKESFQSIYYQIKQQFGDKYRSDGTPYLYHLLETAYIVLEESGFQDCDIETIFIALLHDIIEDTKHDFNSLNTFLGDNGTDVAFGVHLISKPSFSTHIEDKGEAQTYVNCIDIIGSKNIDPSGNIINESVVDLKIVKQYNDLKSKYKPIRNKEHFRNYTDYATFFEHAKNEAQHLGLRYSDTLLDVICKRSINVKLSDRLHNLRTLGHMNDYKVMTKIKETKKYILPIAYEINPTLAEKIQDEINKLEADLIHRIFTAECNCVSDRTTEVLHTTV